MNATNWATNQNETITASMIESGIRKFSVIEENATDAITVEIDRINSDGSVDYCIVENGQCNYYGETSVQDFVDYLSNCKATAIHWTVAA